LATVIIADPDCAQSSDGRDFLPVLNASA